MNKCGHGKLSLKGAVHMFLVDILGTFNDLLEHTKRSIQRKQAPETWDLCSSLQ